VGLLLIVVALQLRFTGRDRPLIHRKIGWLGLLIGIGVVATGMIIALRSFT